MKLKLVSAVSTVLVVLIFSSVAPAYAPRLHDRAWVYLHLWSPTDEYYFIGFKQVFVDPGTTPINVDVVLSKLWSYATLETEFGITPCHTFSLTIPTGEYYAQEDLYSVAGWHLLVKAEIGSAYGYGPAQFPVQVNIHLAGEICVARFYGSAYGYCEVSEMGDETTYLGRGRVHIGGLAIVREAPGFKAYWANASSDPNTRIWTRRTWMKVSWDNKKLMVHMWPSYTAEGKFNDAEDLFGIDSMNFAGYYIGEAGLQYIRGTAEVEFDEELAGVYMFIGTERLSFRMVP